jgi:poly(A) polymerase
VVDPLGGLPDLRARRVRFVGDAYRRIAEDYLRILRFFRFHAWYGDPVAGLDPAGLAACAAGREGLGLLSRERVGAEITRLLAAPNPGPALAAMEATGILSLVLPGAAAGAMPPLVRVEAAACAPPRWQRRLAALGADSDWPSRLRLSRAEAAALAAIATALAAATPPAEAAYRFGADAARDAALVAAARAGVDPPPGLAAEIARGAAAVMPVRAADLPLNGRALGAELRRLEALWIASDFRLGAEELVAASQAGDKFIHPNG